MSGPVRDRAAMIAGMAPRRVAGAVVFRAVAPGEVAALVGAARAMVREAEGVTLVLEAGHPGLPAGAARFVQITLDVPSALDGVGLTAAVAGALADRGIPCNVIAGAHHDHLFVPEAQAEAALAALRARAAVEGRA